MSVGLLPPVVGFSMFVFVPRNSFSNSLDTKNPIEKNPIVETEGNSTGSIFVMFPFPNVPLLIIHRSTLKNNKMMLKKC